MLRFDPDALRERHRRWLSALGILDRPWLILGSAPRPTLPGDLVSRAARIDINNAGRTAAALGLGPADLTIRTHRKSWAEHPDLDTKALLWTHSWPTIVMRWQLSKQKRAKVGLLRRWTRTEREAIVDLVIGTQVTGVGSLGKATTGIAAACYGLFVGAPEIVLSGISVDAPGHSYDERGRPRLQVEEDLFVIERIRCEPRLWTTETSFSAVTGVRLWSGSEERAARQDGAADLRAAAGMRKERRGR